MRITRPLLGLLTLSLLAVPAQASSHREAPFISQHPKLDGTDFYMFNSYEAGRSGFVTIIADYIPLQDAYGGPNYFSLDPNARYDINIDNNGDAKSDLSFQFRFKNNLRDLALNIGGKTISVPLTNIGPISSTDNSQLNVVESYTVDLVKPDSRGALTKVNLSPTPANSSASTFIKPVDNIGNKSIPDYPGYAAKYLYAVNIPGCAVPGRLFVGQRKDPFVVNLGEAFDLVNTNPLGPINAEKDDLADKNVTSLVLEVAASCLTANNNPVIAAWTTASTPQYQVNPTNPTYTAPAVYGGAFIQQSRLANPLVNELVIGLKDKDKFNASRPMDDGQFADYVTNPTLPAILELLFGVTAPTTFPRTDLVSVFLTGVDGLNKTTATAEMMRLNTSIPAIPAAQQNNLGVIAGDTAGYPNGRRPGDDVVDISLRVAMGALLPLDQAPSGQLPYTDGAFVNASFFDQTFPYLKTPIPGSPNNTP